ALQRPRRPARGERFGYSCGNSCPAGRAHGISGYSTAAGAACSITPQRTHTRPNAGRNVTCCSGRTPTTAGFQGPDLARAAEAGSPMSHLGVTVQVGRMQSGTAYLGEGMSYDGCAIRRSPNLAGTPAAGTPGRKQACTGRPNEGT